MHLRFIAEGWDKDLDYMEKWIGQMMLPMKIKDKKGKDKVVGCPCYLRPFRMYDLIFPRENLDIINNTLKPASIVSLVAKKPKIAFKHQIAMLRKLMRLKKIPKRDETKGQVAVPDDLFEHVKIIGLGIKDDIDFVNGITQEALCLVHNFV